MVLKDRVVLVTGASRGLGREMALALAARGARVAAVARTAESLQDTLRAIASAGGRGLALPADVRDAEQVGAMVGTVRERFGRIDVLVNNAGLMAGEAAFADVTPELWREILDTNLWGAFLCCHAVVPAMMENGGVIVNVTSGAAVRTNFLNLPYGVSKAGLDRLTLGLGAELQAHGIACVSLSPPVSATDTVRRLYPDRDVDAWAAPPALTARALCALLEDDPMRYTGRVLSVRDVLAGKVGSGGL